MILTVAQRHVMMTANSLMPMAGQVRGDNAYALVVCKPIMLLFGGAG